MIYQNTQTKVLHYDFSAVGRFIAFSTEDLEYVLESPALEVVLEA